MLLVFNAFIGSLAEYSIIVLDCVESMCIHPLLHYFHMLLQHMKATKMTISALINQYQQKVLLTLTVIGMTLGIANYA